MSTPIDLDSERPVRRGPLSRTEFVYEARRVHARLENGLSQLFYGMNDSDPVQVLWHEQLNMAGVVLEDALVAIERETEGSAEE